MVEARGVKQERWYVEELTGIGVCRIHNTDHDSEKSWISNVYDDKSWPRCREKAYLIAAAPELLEALMRLADCHEAHSDGGICNEDHFDLSLAVGAAIAKAQGQAS